MLKSNKFYVMLYFTKEMHESIQKKRWLRGLRTNNSKRTQLSYIDSFLENSDVAKFIS